MSEINIPSDDKLSSILRAVERVEEKQHNEIEEMKGQLKTFGETWDTAKTRLEILEDKGVNPFQRDLTTNESRRDALKKWLVREYQWQFMNAEERAQSQGSVAAGSGLVPEEVAPEIDRIVAEAGVGRGLCRIVPMTSDTTYLNAMSVGPAVSHPGESTAPSESTATFVRKQLDAKKMVAIDELSFEITEDAPQLVDFLVEVFAEAVAKEEDRVIFGGDESADPFTGFTTAAASGFSANTHAAAVNRATGAAAGANFENIAYSDIVDLVHGVDDNVVNRGTIVLSPDALGFIRKIVDSQGMPIWASFAAGQEPTILGRPYAIATQFPNTDSATKPFAMYGDFGHAFIGQRSGFQVAFSEDAGFTKATRYMRVLQRWAFAIPTGDAFCVLETSAS